MSDSIRFGRSMLLSMIAIAFLCLPALAQRTTTGGAGGGGAGGFGGAGGAGGAGGFGGAGGAGGGNSFGGGLTSTGTGAELTTGRSTAVNTSNAFSSWYANPYSAIAATASASKAVIERTNSAFGQPLYTISTTGARGNTGVRGGTATIGGGRAGANQSNPGDFTVPGNIGTRYPHVATIVQFKAPLPAADVLLSEIRATVERSSSIPSKKDVTITVEGRDVILRGKVASAEERRHVEALLRLTPGVGSIRNELSAPDG